MKKILFLLLVFSSLSFGQNQKHWYRGGVDSVRTKKFMSLAIGTFKTTDTIKVWQSSSRGFGARDTIAHMIIGGTVFAPMFHYYNMSMDSTYLYFYSYAGSKFTIFHKQ